MIMLGRRAAFSCIAVFTILVVLLYIYHIRNPSSDDLQWGSVGQAVLFHTVRKYLLKLDFRREHVKFWRPHILLLVANPRSACPLIDVLNDLKKSGIYILGHVHVTDAPPRNLSEEFNKWQTIVDNLNVKAFVSITESTSFRSGALQIVRVSGLGALKPNTVMIGFRDEVQPEDFLSLETSRYHLKTDRRINIPSNWHPVPDRSTGTNDDLETSVTNSTDLDVSLPAVVPSVGLEVPAVSVLTPSPTPSPNNLQRLSPAQDVTASDESRQPHRVSVHDYVSFLQDALNAGKNLALCRHFHKLNRDAITR